MTDPTDVYNRLLDAEETIRDILRRLAALEALTRTMRPMCPPTRGRNLSKTTQEIAEETVALARALDKALREEKTDADDQK